MQKAGILHVLCVCAVLSCHSPAWEEPLEQALALAKGNNSELEQVLKHYEGDSLKLEAAKFLIANMPGHFSFRDTSTIIRYSNQVDSILDCMKGQANEAIRDSIDNCTKRFCLSDQKTIQDCEVISAEYLIRNIDEAFEQWQRGLWAQHLTFQQFCEYLLPYKAGELQLLDHWRQDLQGRYTDHLDELATCDQYKHSAYRAALTVNKNLADTMKPVASISIKYPFLRIKTLAKLPFATCQTYANLTTTIMRSQGIPVAEDFTPQWAYRSQGHSWNVILNNTGKNMPFGGVCTSLGETYMPDDKMAKVYRRTYAANPDIKRLNQEEHFVPRTFRNIFMQDVTHEYLACSDVTLTFPDQEDGYAYLTVFDDKGWAPVAYGRIKGGKATFPEMGHNVLYMAVRYLPSGDQVTLGDPFILSSEGQACPVLVQPQTTTLELRRKYPVLPYAQIFLYRFLDAEFQASDRADFKTFETIHRITDSYAITYAVTIPDTVRAYRYWRYHSDVEYTYCNMAEINFFDSDGQPVRGTIIGPKEHWESNPGMTQEKAFDGDLLTYFDAHRTPDCWVGMDFGKPVKLSKIIYIGRGDGNAIDLGDTYELMFWQAGEWHSLGQKVATDASIVYEQVPAGGLYLLHDRTKGKDERIFTYENGEQVWW